MIRIIIVYTVIVAAAILHASSVHATEAAYRGAVAANWCHYLGPDCKPYGLSVTAQRVFRYLMATDLGLLGGNTPLRGHQGADRYRACRGRRRSHCLLRGPRTVPSHAGAQGAQHAPLGS